MTRTTHRGTGALIATLLAILLSLSAVAPVHAVEPTPTDDPSEAAAGWLAEQLVDGERLETVFGEDAYPDHGLTADAVFALAAAGVASGNITAAVDWLTNEAETYLGLDWDTVAAGATAKLTLVMVTDGRDPRSVSGLDLVEILLDREVEEEGGDQGRFVDDGETDYSSTLTQSLAVLALHRAAEVSPSDAAVDFLLAQQCEDGGFRFDPDADPCGSDADTTALVVQALAALEGFEDEVAAASNWLAGLQDEDGAVDNGFGPNANTTGLAAVAFELRGDVEAAADARAFLVSLQDGCDGEGTGAILYDPQDDGDRDRATTQAVPGLTGTSLATVTSEGATDAVPALDCEPADDPDDPEEDPDEPKEPDDPEEDPEEAPVSTTATLSCDLDDLQVAPGDNVSCTITELHAGETIDVAVAVNPTLLDEEYVADDDGTVAFEVGIPDDRAAGDVVTMTVSNSDGYVLTDLELTVTEMLPETGIEARIALLGFALLAIGVALLLATRKRWFLA